MVWESGSVGQVEEGGQRGIRAIRHYNNNKRRTKISLMTMMMPIPMKKSTMTRTTTLTVAAAVNGCTIHEENGTFTLHH